MNEQKRQAYLQAMDIQPYFPRQILVGAKPSPVYEFPVIDPPLPESSVTPATAPSGSGSTVSSQSRGLDAIDELRARAAPSRKAQVRPIREDREEEPSQERATPAENKDDAATASLHFNLRYYRINEAVAVLDEMPPQGSGQLSLESQKLLQAILKALNLDYPQGNERVEEFSWPVQAGYSPKHAPEVEAARGLAGFLRMRKETDGFANLLVFAGQIEALILQTDQARAARDFESDRGYFITVTHSLASILAVPALKRDVWQQLQPLRRRLASPD